MARIGRRFPTQSEIRKPTVLAAPVTFRPLAVKLTDQNRAADRVRRRGTGSFYRPPQAVGAPAVTFLPDPVRVDLTRRRTTSKHLREGSTLRPPAVVAAPVTFRPVDLTTVRQPRKYQHPLPRKITPAVVGAPVTFRPIEQWLTDRAKAAQIVRRATYCTLRPPAVVTTATVDMGVVGERIALTRRRPERRRPMRRLSPPAVVAAPVTFRPVVVRLAKPAPPARFGSRRRASSHLFPPTVIDPSTPVVSTASLRTLMGVGT